MPRWTRRGSATLATSTKWLLVSVFLKHLTSSPSLTNISLISHMQVYELHFPSYITQLRLHIGNNMSRQRTVIYRKPYCLHVFHLIIHVEILNQQYFLEYSSVKILLIDVKATQGRHSCSNMLLSNVPPRSKGLPATTSLKFLLLLNQDLFCLRISSAHHSTCLYNL